MQEAQAEFNCYKNFSIDDVHHWIWLYWDLWTNKGQRLWTPIGRNGPGQPGNHYLSGSHTAVSPWSISAVDHQLLNNHTQGDVMVSSVTQTPTVKTKNKTNRDSFVLDIISVTFHCTLSNTASNKVPTRALIWTFAVSAIKPAAKIQS